MYLRPCGDHSPAFKAGHLSRYLELCTTTVHFAAAQWLLAKEELLWEPGPRRNSSETERRTMDIITWQLLSVMENGKGYKLWFLSQDNGQRLLKGFIQVWGINHTSTLHKNLLVLLKKTPIFLLVLLNSVCPFTLLNQSFRKVKTNWRTFMFSDDEALKQTLGC